MFSKHIFILFSNLYIFLTKWALGLLQCDSRHSKRPWQIWAPSLQFWAFFFHKCQHRRRNRGCSGCSCTPIIQPVGVDNVLCTPNIRRQESYFLYRHNRQKSSLWSRIRLQLLSVSAAEACFSMISFNLRGAGVSNQPPLGGGDYRPPKGGGGDMMPSAKLEAATESSQRGDSNAILKFS